MTDCVMSEKMDALGIIFGAPLWPQREELPLAGHALFDAMVVEAKDYALSIARGDFASAFAILGRWSHPVNALIEASHIKGSPPAEAMLAVFLHYADAALVNFEMIER